MSHNHHFLSKATLNSRKKVEDTDAYKKNGEIISAAPMLIAVTMITKILVKKSKSCVSSTRGH